jgi:hypothetical protein
MATVFKPKTALTVRVLQSITVTHKDPVSGSRPGIKTSAWKRRPNSPFLICPEVGMPGTSPVVVLQDGTVGTVMVPKQT